MHRIAIVLVAGVLAACDAISGSEETVAQGFEPVWTLPWPEHDTLPDCQQERTLTDWPKVESSIGDVVLGVSADYIPIGVDETVEIGVLEPDSGKIDTSANGQVEIRSALLSDTFQGQIENGVGRVTIRFGSVGEGEVTAQFKNEENDQDVREGRRGMVIYETRLPIFEMDISDADWDTLMGNLEERIKVPVVLTVDGISYESKVRIHGASSRSYPKKSFRFDLEDDLTLPDTHDHIILRAEWNDKSLLRNYLSLALFRNGTWLPTPNAEMIHFRINNRYYGVMWRVERIGGDFLRLRGMNKDTCSMYEADPDGSCWVPGGNLTPLSGLAEYMCVYDLKKGPLEYTDLIDFIENTLQLPDVAFAEEIGLVLDLDAYFVYQAMMAVIGNRDHIKKNYYMYRDPEEKDDRWIFFPWDMELTFGHIWTEENDVLDEGIHVDMSPEYIDFNNRLIEKLFVHPRFVVRYYDIMTHILDETFTLDFVESRVAYALCNGMPDIWADTRKRASRSEYLSRVAELSTYVEKRRDFLLDAL